MHTMTLYSDPNCAQSHRVRIVLGEKDLVFNVVDVNNTDNNEDLIALNPNNTTPTFVDRNLVLYESRVIMEYLDERFPHPPLLPVYPVSRAHIRLFIQRIQRDWCETFDALIEGTSEAKAKKMRAELKSQILGMSPILKEKDYFMSDEFSLVDCCIAPILWRLPLIGIELQKDAKTKPIYEYMQRVFTKSCFVNSLSELEKEIREV